MPTIKVTDIAHVRLQSPDLDQAEQFLVDFGMIRAARTATRLYMRGTDPDAYIHVTELGPARFLGLAFKAASDADLAKVAAIPGASGIETIDGPGGGKRVRLTDPHGHDVEIVHGREPVAALPLQRNVMNWGEDRTRRVGELTRLKPGPSQVKRIGHAVLKTPRLPEVMAWYRDAFGFVTSDAVYAGSPDHVIASFNRCDRGDEYTDHHTFLCIAGEKPGLNHVAFEVRDIDDVMLGHEHLRSKSAYEHHWGVGRHVLGSQVFDYWADPWGRVHEHWSDTDLLNIHSKPNLLSAQEGLASQWGAPAPQKFIDHVST